MARCSIDMNILAGVLPQITIFALGGAGLRPFAAAE
jgi:hypothetical protein